METEINLKIDYMLKHSLMTSMMGRKQQLEAELHQLAMIKQSRAKNGTIAMSSPKEIQRKQWVNDQMEKIDHDIKIFEPVYLKAREYAMELIEIEMDAKFKAFE